MLDEFKKFYESTSVRNLGMLRSEWQRNLLLKLTSTDPDIQRVTKKALLGEHKTRATAYQYVRALDHQLSLIGCPLSRFWASAEGNLTAKVR